MADRTMAHWRVLAAIGMMSWGTYFIYDIPASLSTPLSKHLSFSDHETAYLVSLLYAVYSTPNTVLPFLTGAALQRFGERTLLMGIVSSITLGQVLFALAVQNKIEVGMIIGRAFIGLGGEVISVVGCEIITRWFQYKRLSLALAINLGLGRLGSVSNCIIVPYLIEPYGVVIMTWMATLLSLGVTIIGLVSFLTTPDSAIESDKSPLLSHVLDTDCNTKPVSQSFPLRHFPPVFWYLALIALLDYACLNTFTNSAQRLLALRFYDGDQPAAGAAVSILFTLSGLLIAPLGFLLDMLPSSSYPCALITSNALLMFAHGIFLMNSITAPIIPLCLIGLADALIGVAFWGSVTRCLLNVSFLDDTVVRLNGDFYCETVYKDEIVPLMQEDIDIPPFPNEETGIPAVPIMQGEAMRTLGIGIMASLMNISTAVVPVLLAVVENLEGFMGLEVVFLALGLLGCMVCVKLAWAWELDSDGTGDANEGI
ncbi:major facilitator superfamily domain-containing protein [Aspergillus heterothallicus]